MSLLLITEFEKFLTYKPEIDIVQDLIERHRQLGRTDSGLRVFQVPMGEQINATDYEQWLVANDLPEFDGIRAEYELQEREINTQIGELEKLYLTPIQDLRLSSMTLKQLNFQLQTIVLRLNRLYRIKDVNIATTTGVHKATDIKYQMARALWYDDDGKERRSVNKNVGDIRWGLEELASKMFKILGYETLIPEPTGDNRLVDLIISKGGKKWLVDIKLKNKDQLVKTYIGIELWKKYKKIYGID